MPSARDTEVMRIDRARNSELSVTHKALSWKVGYSSGL